MCSKLTIKTVERRRSAVYQLPNQHLLIQSQQLEHYKKA